jgi:L-alanine-DL-glutamate epimerase-like enolase superfamily enzyme
VPVDGYIKAPEEPGHGIQFRPELLKDCKIGGREIG